MIAGINAAFDGSSLGGELWHNQHLTQIFIRKQGINV
jgi:hypothetical protein